MNTPLYPNLYMVEGELNNKINNKRHKTDEKITHFAVNFYPSTLKRKIARD